MAGYACLPWSTKTLHLSADSISGWRIANQLSYEYTGKNFRPVERFRKCRIRTRLESWYVNYYQRRTHCRFPRLHWSNPNWEIWVISWNPIKKEVHTKVGWILYLQIQLRNMQCRVEVFWQHRDWLLRQITRVTMQKFPDLCGDLLWGARENAEQNKFCSGGKDLCWTVSLIRNLKDSSPHRTLSTSREVPLVSNKGLITPVISSFRAAYQSAGKGILLLPLYKTRTNTQWIITTLQNSILDSSLSSPNLQKTLLNRIDHGLTLWKGVITANTYYEVGNGTGNENREYYYSKFLDKVYTPTLVIWMRMVWKISMNLPLLHFRIRQKFIRVFVPTNSYITTRSNQFAGSIVNPTAAGGGAATEGKTSFLYRWSDQLFSAWTRKPKMNLCCLLSIRSAEISETVRSYLLIQMWEEHIVFQPEVIRFWADITWQEIKNKILSDLRIQTRSIQTTGLNLCMEYHRRLPCQSGLEQGDKRTSSISFLHAITESFLIR